MSLLTSPHTTREQLRFFGKMEREYNRRSFHNSNYSETPSPLQQVNDNTDRSQQLIREAMHSFLMQLRNIVADSHNSRVDYYFVLSEMKNTDFFSEVAAIIEKDIAVRSGKLEKENLRLREEVKRALQRVRDLERSEPQSEKSNEYTRFNGIKTIPQNLYEKAKTLNQQEFIDLCNRAILGDKVVISKVTDSPNYRRWEQAKPAKVQEKEIMRRIDNFLQVSKSGQLKQLADLVQQLKNRIAQTSPHVECNRPCCQILPDTPPAKPSKAAALRRSTQARRKEAVYKNDRSQEYFNRYYRRGEFQVQKVTSVQKTKLQEMEKMEDDYRVSLKHRRKNFSLLSSR